MRWRSLWSLYALANFFILATWNDKFWDAWVMYADVNDLESAERSCSIDRCKVPFTYLWEQPLLRIGDWTIKLLVILGFAIAGWLFNKLLKFSGALTELQCSIATVLFILLPINGARIGLSTARASILLPIFLLGAILFTYRKWILTSIGFLLVLYACFQPSFQTYVIAIAAVFAARDLSLRGIVSRRTWTIAFWLGAIPFIHQYFLGDLIVRLGFAGAPDNYNTILPAFALRAVLVCGLLTTPLSVSLVKQLWRRKSLSDWRPTLLSVGLGLLALGTFPYMAVGHFANLSDWIIPWLPDTSDWDSRHQLLQGPGFAIAITAILTGAVLPQRRMIALNALVLVSVVISLSTYSNYHVDGLKQRDILLDLRSAADEFDGISLVTFSDLSLDLNARGRGIRDYEWKGMVETALGKPMTIWEKGSPELGCRSEVIGKTITIRKTSGRLKATLTRSRVASIDITDLIACR